MNSRRRSSMDWMLEEEDDHQEETSSTKHPDEEASGGWSDFLRRSFSKGKDKKPPNEDNARQWFPRMELPREVAKEIARATLSQAERAKSETLKIVASEVRGFLNQTQIWDEVRKLMHGTTIDIQMKIRLKHDDETGGISPKVEVSSVEAHAENGTEPCSEKENEQVTPVEPSEESI